MNGVLSMLPQGVLAGQDDPMMDPRRMAILRAGLSMMSNSGPSLTPVSMGQTLGKAGGDALQGYQQAQQAQKQNLLMNMQMLQLRKELEKSDALKNLFGNAGAGPTAGPSLPQQALTEGAAQGDVGPTVTNAARLTALQSSPTAQSGYQPIPVNKLAGAAAAGVNIDPFLKLNAEARPDVMHVDLGDKVRVIDKKTMKVLGEVPKGSAPGARPFEASDQTPAAYRDFQITKAATGANRSITNVNSFVPASEAAQRDFMQSASKNYDALRSAPVTLKNIEEAKKLIPGAKGFMGPGGESLLEAAKFLKNRLGINVATEGVKNAEELRSRIFFQIMDNLKKMDAQPSQMQQQVMMDALGKLGTDPNALASVLDAFSEAIRGKVDIHNREVQSAVQRGVRFPFDPVIALPEPSKADEAPKPGNRIRYDAQGNRL